MYIILCLSGLLLTVKVEIHVRTLINQIIQSVSFEKDNIFINLTSIPKYHLKHILKTF